MIVVDSQTSVKYYMVGSYVIVKEALVRVWKTRYMIYKVLEGEFDPPAHLDFQIDDSDTN